MNRRACGGGAARHHLSAAHHCRMPKRSGRRPGPVPESEDVNTSVLSTSMLKKRPVAARGIDGRIKMYYIPLTVFIQLTEGVIVEVIRV